MDFYSPRAVALWDISAFPGIADATLFAFGRRGPDATGNKVYRVPFDLDSDTVGAPVEAWSNLPAGEEITAIEFDQFGKIKGLAFKF
jgi:hypothetical protein